MLYVAKALILILAASTVEKTIAFPQPLDKRLQSISPTYDEVAKLENKSNVAATGASSIVVKLNNAMNSILGYGFIFRNRWDGLLSCDQTLYKPWSGWCKPSPWTEVGAVSTYLHNEAFTPNPVYCLQPMYSSVLQGAKVYPPGDPCVETPSVGYAFFDAWKMNGGQLSGFAYYATDANSIDGRTNPDPIVHPTKHPGQGCHVSNQICGPGALQQYPPTCAACENAQTCFTYPNAYDSKTGTGQPCKCNYFMFNKPDKEHPALNSNEFGEMLVDALHAGVPASTYTKFAGGGGLYPSFIGQDYSACWFEESDFCSNGDCTQHPTWPQLLTRTQNSIYLRRASWWNGGKGSSWAPDPSARKNNDYEGWNEVAMDPQIDHLDRNSQNCHAGGGCAEALVIALPKGKTTLQSVAQASLESVDNQLLHYWCDGYSPPVVFMKQVEYDKANMLFRKVVFEQPFTFASGSRIKQPPGYKTYYYYPGQTCDYNV